MSLLGGKWTTYRQMGEDTVEKVLASHPSLRRTTVYPRSISSSVHLLGSYTSKSFESDGEEKDKGLHDFIKPYTDFLVQEYNIDPDSARILVRCYGSLSVQVAELGRKTNTLEVIHPSSSYLKVQVLYAIRNEFSVKTTDVLFRRLGISFVDQNHCSNLVKNVVDIMGDELKWNQSKKEKEIATAMKNINTML